MSSACKPSPFSGPFSGPFSSPFRVLVTSVIVIAITNVGSACSFGLVDIVV